MRVCQRGGGVALLNSSHSSSISNENEIIETKLSHFHRTFKNEPVASLEFCHWYL